MSTSDTSAIDEKKNPVIASPGIGGFANVLISQIITLIVIVVIGSLFLYTGKVAQTNLLPTNLEYKPYTDVSPPIITKPVDINILHNAKGDFSTKIEFPLDENLENMSSSFTILKNFISGPTSNIYKLYIGKSLEQAISLNFTVINTVYNFSNTYLPETLIVHLGPIMLLFIQLITFIINMFYLSILWFSNIHLLFSEKTESNGKTVWTDGNMWSLLNFSVAILSIGIFILLFFICGIIIPILALLISCYCFFYPLFMKSKYSQTTKSYGIVETIKNVFKFKKKIIMIILSICIIADAGSSMGPYSALVAGVACFGFIVFSSVYDNYVPKQTDHLTSGIGDFKQFEFQTK